MATSPRSDGSPPLPSWLGELVLRPEHAMGVHPLDPAEWLLTDDRRGVELDLRATLLDERHDEVFAALPATEDAGRETLELVQQTLGVAPREQQPRAVDRHPLERAGRLVQEDLCLMVDHDGEYRLDAACLCFPSHWRLREKLGGSAAVIHGPVPRYDPDLRDRVDGFLARLRPERPVWRRNWSIHDHDVLFAPWPPPPRPIDADRIHAELVLRSERQTLRRLPRTGAIVFTIKTQQSPISVLADRPDLASALAMTLRTMPADIRNSRVAERHLDPLLDWLDRTTERAGPEGPALDERRGSTRPAGS